MLARTQERHRFVKVRTASVGTAEGRRYLSGLGYAVVRHVRDVLSLALHQHRSLLLIADGAH